jgi:GT2 family glycosyltransferase
MAYVSVHIVTYNSAATIATCLKALLDQTFTDLDIRIIDNASADDTVRRINQMGVDVICNPVNVGYSAAHNQAIDSTNSTYVLTLNPDARLAPTYIESLTHVLDANPQVGSAAGCLLRVGDLDEDPTVIDSTGLLMRPNRHAGLRYEGLPVSERPMQIDPIFGPDGAAAFYRRDTDFFLQKEDIDLCWRAQLRGWSSLYVPYAIARHVRTFRPGQRKRVSAQLRFYGIRNRYLLVMKNDVLGHFLHDFAAIALYDMLILAYVALKEQESWSAFLSAMSMFRKMMKKRQVIQSGRRVELDQLRRWFQPEAASCRLKTSPESV